MLQCAYFMGTFLFREVFGRPNYFSPSSFSPSSSSSFSSSFLFLFSFLYSYLLLLLLLLLLFFFFCFFCSSSSSSSSCKLARMLTRIGCHVSGPDDRKKEPRDKQQQRSTPPTPEDSYAKGNIRKVLKLLLIKRPTIEELERKGIIKGILQLCLLHVQKSSFRKLPSLLFGQ